MAWASSDLRKLELWQHGRGREERENWACLVEQVCMCSFPNTSSLMAEGARWETGKLATPSQGISR